MKYRIGLMVAAALALCACGNQGQAQSKAGEGNAQPAAEAAKPAATKSVVVYYSQTGTTKKLAGVNTHFVTDGYLSD